MYRKLLAKIIGTPMDMVWVMLQLIKKYLNMKPNLLLQMKVNKSKEPTKILKINIFLYTACKTCHFS